MKTARTLLPVLLLGTVAACDGKDPVAPPTDSGIAVPTAYAFDSRFQSGVSSVQYPGQTVRNLLVQDLATLIKGLAKAGATPITAQALLDLYEHDDAKGLTTRTTAGTFGLEEGRYSAIATEKRLAGTISNAVVVGYGKTADALLREWFQTIAENSNDPKKIGTAAVYTTAEGVDLSQMVEKVLHGAVAYSQGTGKYLSDGVLFAADNSVAVEGKPYTKMEHYWDEAFGYFGAARDYATYTDDVLAGSAFFKDSDGNGRINLQSEYNFAFAKNAGKRDRGGQGVDFTKDAFDAFLRGRTAIVNQGTRAEVIAQRDAAVRTWEKVIAATVVHYANSTLKALPTVTAEQVTARNHADLNKYWAEMRAFTIALQYNPAKQISDAQLQRLAELMGTAPPYADLTGAAAKLNEAKGIFKAAYGFSDANLAGW